MRCPFCQHIEDRVIDSRLSKDGDLIRRRRECAQCQRRFTTYERVEETLPLIIKKDGRREIFDRNKSWRGSTAPARSAPSAWRCWRNWWSGSNRDSRKWGTAKSRAG